MLGPGGSAKHSPASRLYGPRRAANTPPPPLPPSLTAGRARTHACTAQKDTKARATRTQTPCIVSTDAEREQYGRLTMELGGILFSILILSAVRGEGLCQQGCVLIRSTNSGVSRGWGWSWGGGYDYKVLRLLVPSHLTMNPHLLPPHFLLPRSLPSSAHRGSARRQVSQLPLLFAFQFLNYPEQADKEVEGEGDGRFLVSSCHPLMC